MKVQEILWVFFILVVFICLSFRPSAAQIMERTHQPSYRFSFGVQTEVSTREIKEDSFVFNGIEFPPTKAFADRVRLFGRLSVHFLDSIEVYGLIGGTDLAIDDFSGFDANFTLAYGGGVHIVYYRVPSLYKALNLFINYRYMSFRAKSDILFQPVDCDLNTNRCTIVTQSGLPELLQETIVWNEHVVKLGATGRHDFFEPYGGLSISIVRGEDRIPSPTQKLRLDFREGDVVGLFLGTNIFLDRTEKALFFVEGSIIDKLSLNFGVRVRY